MTAERGVWCGLDGNDLSLDVTTSPLGRPTCPACLAEMAAQGTAERKPRITAEDVQRLVEEGVELRHEFEARTGKTRG